MTLTATDNNADNNPGDTHRKDAILGGQRRGISGTKWNTTAPGGRRSYNQIMYRLDLSDPRLKLPVEPK